MKSIVVRSKQEWNAQGGVDGLETRPAMRSVLMVDPEHFRVAYAINVHMQDENGGLKVVDPDRAREQWEQVRRTYERIGYRVDVIPGDPELPDQVFVSNPVLAVPSRDGQHQLIPSVMRHEERAREVPVTMTALGSRYGALASPRSCLEGHGDVVWHPTRRLLIGGYGFRTEEAALEQVAALADCPVLGLRLVDSRWYHLDTCLSPLDDQSALLVEPAFDQQGRELLESVFPRLIEVPTHEAEHFLAGNAHCPDGRNVVLDAGATETIDRLKEAGFVPWPVDTSEFRKAGGSVFCMKLMLP